MLNKILITIFTPMLAFGALSEEKKIVEISKHLKSISDSSWVEMIGPKTSDVYDIQKGDTLWDISKRLFGNSNYWPKVWALNSSISNPHIISPGNKLIFNPGNADTLPSLASDNSTALAANETTSNSTLATSSNSNVTGVQSKQIHEYDRVSQDLWKPLVLEKQELSKKYDEYGIEKDIRLKPERKDIFRVPAIANDTTVPYLGTIVSSQRDGVGLSQNEAVFIESEGQDLQVGTTYAVYSDPAFVSEYKSDRSGYVYFIKAEIKIIGIKDKTYIGIITRSFDAIMRGDHLYPAMPIIRDLKPVAANEALESVIVLNPFTTSWSTAQYHFVHFDRGLEDGVHVGNVFRIYEYYDPVTKEKITDNDVIVKAEALVVHATAQFSTALVIASKNTIIPGDFGVLLTDVTSLERKIKDRSRDVFHTGDTTSDPELDELDQLDKNSDDGIGNKEKQEIKEIEKWDSNNSPTEEISEPDANTPEPTVEPTEPSTTPEDLTPPVETPSEPEKAKDEDQTLDAEPMTPEEPSTSNTTPSDVEPNDLPQPPEDVPPAN